MLSLLAGEQGLNPSSWGGSTYASCEGLSGRGTDDEHVTLVMGEEAMHR